MGSALFCNAGFILIISKHPINVAIAPSITTICVEQRNTIINYYLRFYYIGSAEGHEYPDL